MWTYHNSPPFSPDGFSRFPPSSQTLDGSFYDHVKEYLMSFCRMELEAFQAVHTTFQFLLEKSSRVRPWHGLLGDKAAPLSVC